MKKILTAIVAVLMATNVWAFDIIIRNDTNKRILYRCHRYDHNFPSHPGPFQYAVGELQPNNEVIIENRDGNIHSFTIEHEDESKQFFAFDAIPNKIFIIVRKDKSEERE
jgi:hypothetical protein